MPSLSVGGYRESTHAQELVAPATVDDASQTAVSFLEFAAGGFYSVHRSDQDQNSEIFLVCMLFVFGFCFVVVVVVVVVLLCIKEKQSRAKPTL